MKTKKQQPKVRQIQNIRSGELFVTSSQWPIKDIDGVSFITVKKSIESVQTHLMRKDVMKFVK
jgi:hypothetical protein